MSSGGASMSHPSSSDPLQIREEQPAFDGDWLDARLLDLADGHDDDSYSALIDCYIVLEGACRDEDFPSRASRRLVSDRATHFVPHIARDINHVPKSADASVATASSILGHQKPALNLAQAALRFTGFLLLVANGDACHALDDSQQAAILDSLLQNLAGCALRDKVTMQLTIWCLKVQSFRPEVLAVRAAELIHLLGEVLEYDFESRSVEHETLRCYLRLMEQVPAAMTACAVDWGLRVIALVTSDAVQLRDTAVKALTKGRPFLTDAYQTPVGSKRLTTLLSANDHAFSTKMRGIATANGSAAESHVEGGAYAMMIAALGLIIELLGPAAKLTHPAPGGNRTLGNNLIRLLEPPLGGTLPSTTTNLALGAWATFCDVLLRGEIRKADVWKTLMLPLNPTGKLRSRRPLPTESTSAHIACMWRIVSGVDWTGNSGPAPTIEDVVLPLLQLCFPTPDLQPVAGTEAMAEAVLHTLVAVSGSGPNGAAAHAQIRPMRQPLDTHLLAKSPEALERLCSAVVAGYQRAASTADASNLPGPWLESLSQLGSRATSAAGKGPAVAPGSGAAVLVKTVVEQALGLAKIEDGDGMVISALGTFVEAAPSHLLFAAQCRVNVAERAGGSVPALQLCFETAFQGFQSVGPDDTASVVCFVALLDRLVRAATSSPDPLFYFSTPIRLLRLSSGLSGHKSLGFSTWRSIVEALRVTPDVFEGTDETPNFAVVVDALVLPLQISATNPTVLRAPKFLTEWTALVDSFCHRASLLAAGKMSYHIEVLANAVAQVNVDADVIEENEFSTICSCVATILRSIKIPASASDISFDDPKRSCLRSPLALVHSIMRAAQARLAAAAWDARTTPQYAAVIKNLTTLLGKVQSNKAIKEIELLIVPPAIEFLQHGIRTRGNGQRRQKTAAPLETAFVELWKTIVPKIATRHQDDVGDASVTSLTPVFLATLLHQTPAVVDASIDLWNRTLGDQPWVELSAELSEVAAQVQASHSTFLMPGALPTTAAVAAAPVAAPSDESDHSGAAEREDARAQKKRGVTKIRTFIGRTDKFVASNARPATEAAGTASTGSPKRAAGSPKRKARSLDEDSHNFIDVAPSSPAKKRLLTEHQREARDEQRVRRREQPATYTALDESQGGAAAVANLGVSSDSTPDSTPSPPAKAKSNSKSQRTSRSPSLSSSRSSTSPASRGARPSRKRGDAATPPSILKLQGRARASDLKSPTEKKRRVSFDLEQNTVHAKSKMPSPLKFDLPASATTRRASHSPATSAAQSTGGTFGSPPPPSGMSPIRSSTTRGKTRGEQMVGGIIVDTFVLPPSPLQKADDAPTRTVLNLKSPSQDAAAYGVQRCLEPAMTPNPSAIKERKSICAGLANCSRDVTEVLPFFHITTSARRSIGILLRGQKLATVGEFCSLSPEDFAKLPVKMTTHTLADLEKYAKKMRATKHKSRTTSVLAQYVGRAQSSKGPPTDAPSEPPSPSDPPAPETPMREPFPIARQVDTPAGEAPAPAATSPVLQALLSACTLGGLAASKEELRNLPRRDQEELGQQLSELLRSVSGST